MRNTITLPDGYKGDTVKCYAEPIEVDGNMAKLQVAEPGKEHMIRWARIVDIKTCKVENRTVYEGRHF